MAKISEKYEALYIINPQLTEEGTQALVEKFKKQRAPSPR